MLWNPNKSFEGIVGTDEASILDKNVLNDEQKFGHENVKENEEKFPNDDKTFDGDEESENLVNSDERVENMIK